MTQYLNDHSIYSEKEVPFKSFRMVTKDRNQKLVCARTLPYNQIITSRRCSKMMKKITLPFSARNLALTLLLGSLFFALGSAALSPEPANESPSAELTPTPEQQTASRDIARQLEYGHYRTLPINRELSSQVFDRYLESLDPQKLYLSQEDLDTFADYRYRLDSAIKSGQLDPAFRIYNRFQSRQVARLEKVLKQLEDGIDKLDFEREEAIPLDRKEAAWAPDQNALDDIWRKRIKSGVLAQRLDGKSDEQIAESLVKRYKGQKKRAGQARSEDVFQTYMNAVTTIYDPHTQYFSPRTSENFNINMSLSLEGIGAVLQSDNEFTKVVRLVPAGPADKNGRLKPADRIVGVGQGENGEVINVIGWRLDEVVDLIRGPKHSTVRLEVIPAKTTDESKTRLISIVRDRVKLEDQSAKSDIIDIQREDTTRRIGIIHIPTFYADFRAMQLGDPNARSTTRDVQQLIQEMRSGDGIDGLIIDLRNNGGGALQEAISLTGLFIEEGPTVQVRTADDRVRVYDDPDDAVLYNGPLAVLVNRMSASASEIFAAAIQDYGRGYVVGEQTFGKGTVQAVRGLSHGQLKLTEAKFYRISGGSTQHRGVIPDIEMPSTIDHTLIGEDTLPTALPWDQITPVKYRRVDDIQDELPVLVQRHNQRILENPEFVALRKEIDYIADLRNTKEVSLKESRRRLEWDGLREAELSVVNGRRVAEGLPAFRDYNEFESWQEDEATRQDSQKLIDLFTRETAEILVDSLDLDTQVASHSSSP